MSQHTDSKKPADQEQAAMVRGNDNRLLLGITGGIASGKSTVAKMLEEMGAPLVDFDILSRIVVEPGKEAWKDIVSFFGEHILLENRHLDRKKLSDIIFKDARKRKKLEDFIHPRIQLEFIRQIDDISRANPGAIIQVAVPLLIEADMQHLFHKIIVVYITRDAQIERLMKRDGITEQEALDILNAQMHIDEKLIHADYIIKNEYSIEDTRKQVEILWQKLVEIQKERCER